ncbi:WD40/YVTN/BNR-like repeat-containing protein [Kibdelosporangium aridum]|uniref:WD40/YVTN/BNR-like repeat-containing protein n=1 Tax=Kibdelosporangium aridum TaxID=2030 RepID=UPI000525A544
MPDLDFDGLRNNLHDSVQQPPVSDVITRAQRRSSRRRLQIVSAATVVLVVGAVPLLRLGVQRDTATPLSPSDQNFVVSMDFYDLTNGFVLGGSCEHRPICDAWVMAAGDATDWEKRTAPPIETGFSGQQDRLVALGISTLIIDDHRPGNVVKRFFSSDGARTWQEVPTQSGPTPYTKFAPSTILECHDGKVTALLPGNGHSVELANQPPFRVKSCQPYPDQRKTWWVAGVDTATGKPMVASTMDGETWTASALPSFTPPPAEQITSADYPAISVTTSPTAVYATVTNPGDSPADLVAIFRSTDSGVTWQQTWQAAEGKQPTSISGVPVAGTDGKLRISQYPRVTNEVWTSADGGKSFAGEPSENAADVRWIRMGYLATRSDSSSTGQFLTSYDGIRWRPTKLQFP